MKGPLAPAKIFPPRAPQRALRADRGFTLIEVVIALLVGTVLTAMAIPVWVQAQASMRLNSMVSATSAAISQTRYRSIMTSQIFSLTINSPADTYVVTNVSTNVSESPIPLTPQAVAINGGGGGAYYLFCPNGMVWASGTSCPGTGVPPTLTAAFAGRQINLNVSSVGNVTTVHVK